MLSRCRGGNLERHAPGATTQLNPREVGNGTVLLVLRNDRSAEVVKYFLSRYKSFLSWAGLGEGILRWRISGAEPNCSSVLRRPHRDLVPPLRCKLTILLRLSTGTRSHCGAREDGQGDL